MVFKVLRVCGLGVLGYMSPRILVGIGIPLDDWAQRVGQFIRGTSEMMPDDVLFAVLGGLFAIVFITAEIWFDLVKRLIDKLKSKKEQIEILDARAPLIELRDLAAKDSWDFNAYGSTHIIDFAKALQQAGLDGELKFWGRPNKSSINSVNLNEPLNEIEKEHWKDFIIEPIALFQAENNADVYSYNAAQNDWREGNYIDIHTSEDAAAKWLRTTANSFKGVTK